MSVDSRIVTMKFDNAQFESSARTSMSTLDKLRQSMDFGKIASGAVNGLGTISSALGKIGVLNPFTKIVDMGVRGFNMLGGVIGKFTGRNPFERAQTGITDLQSEANSFQMTSMEGAVTGISSKFLALSTIAITALANITNKAVDSSLRIAKSFTIAPITDGFAEYETKIGSIQTILSNTARHGTKLPEVEKNLDELNKYADKTIYNFGEMTRNIGLFTNAGIKVGDATQMIKGFSNEAAASGTSSAGAAGAAYQLSQALSAGTIRLMDWRSLTNVGMGNKNMQNGVVALADAMGTLDKAGISSKTVMQDFNGSLEKKWLSADVMSKYLRIMAGDMDEAEMKTLGLSKAQIKMFQTQQKNAEEAATKVRTFTQLVGTIKESVGSGWSETIELLLGDFNSATKLFTGINNVVGGVLGDWTKARNDMLRDWVNMGGRNQVLTGLKASFQAIGAVLKTVGSAFREVFPAKTAGDLLRMSQSFSLFAQSLKPSEETLDKIRRTFRGVFSIFSIIGQVISAVAGQFKRLFSSMSSGSGDFLEFTASVGDSITNFSEFLKQSGLITTFFEGLGSLIAVPLNIIKGLAAALGSIFSGFNEADIGSASTGMQKFNDKLSQASQIGERVADIFRKLTGFFKQIGKGIGNAIASIGDAIGNAITPQTFDKTLSVINTSLLGGLVLLIRKFFSGGVKLDLTGGLFSGITSTLGAATGAFQNMQKSLKADILLKIAGAIGVMALALFVLSSIDPKAMTIALGSMAAGFGVLIGAMTTLLKVMGPAGLVQLYVVTSAMTKMALSILLLSFALKTLASLKFDDMLVSLITLGGAMFILSKAMGPLAANSKGMAKASFSLILVGVALNFLAVALKIMGSMSWEEMAKGMVGMAGSMAIFAGAMRLMPKGAEMRASAVSLLVLSVALNALAIAMKIFATMSWIEMARGLVAMAGGLALLVLALKNMPKKVLLQSTALVAVASAMVVLGTALKLFATMSWGDIAKGLGVLGGSLAILAIGLNAMNGGALAGAAALVVATAALSVLTPALITLGTLSWSTILTGLGAIAGVFIVLGVAGYALAPVVPVIIGLALSLTLIGTALALAGVGALAFATAFGVIVAAGMAGVNILVAMLQALMAQIPLAMQAFGEGIIAFATAIAAGGPAFLAAFVTILTSMIDAVIQVVPKLRKMFDVLLSNALGIIVKWTPRIIRAGFDLIIGFLRQVENNIPRIVPLAARIIISFLNELGDRMPDIVDAGVRLVIKFINGVSQAIDKHSEDLGKAGGRLAASIISGLARGLRAFAKESLDAAIKAVTDRIPWGVKKFLGIASPSKVMHELGTYATQGLANGVRDEIPLVERSAQHLAEAAIMGVQDSMRQISSAVQADMDMNPTITPVLDLSNVQSGASRLGTLLGSNPLSTDVAYSQAASIAANQKAGPGVLAGSDGQSSGPVVQFYQTNNSPESLSTIDIYRQTRNQLSLAKEALKV